jgi:hypothetical protein
VDLFNRVCEIWKRCHSGHFFADLSLEDSQARCRLLDRGPADMEGFDSGRER